MSGTGGDDLLRQATRALRDTAEPAGDEARFTRSRVLASLRESRVQRRTRVAFLVPLLAAALAVTAGATESGRAFFRTATEYVGFRAPREGPVVARRPSNVMPPPVVSPAAPPVKEPTVSVAPAREIAAVPRSKPADPTGGSVASGSVGATQATRAVPSAAFDPAHALYLEAHALHFTEQDPARALGAWNSYLALAPGGRFALEARYNRALCLVRLGRRDEAGAALEPFASGASGEYRQEEARKLLEALSGATVP